MTKDANLPTAKPRSDFDLEHDWIFTFGIGGPRAGMFVRIRGTFMSARGEMLRRYGREWAFQYRSEEEAGVAAYGLTELTTCDGR